MLRVRPRCSAGVRTPSTHASLSKASSSLANFAHVSTASPSMAVTFPQRTGRLVSKCVSQRKFVHALVRAYGSSHGHADGHHPAPKSLVDEYGQALEYDKDGKQITGQDPAFYAEKGVKFVMEDWEKMYWAVLVLALVITVGTLATREETSLTIWAQEEIQRRRAARERLAQVKQ